MTDVKTMDVTAEMSSGTLERVTVRNPDLCRWDIERDKTKWPMHDKAPILWLTFITWAAMMREGRYSEPFKTFREADCLNIEVKDDADTDVDPTRQDPAPEPP